MPEQWPDQWPPRRESDDAGDILDLQLEEVLLDLGVEPEKVRKTITILKRKAGKEGKTVWGYIGIDPRLRVSKPTSLSGLGQYEQLVEDPPKEMPKPKKSPKTFRTVLPAMSASDMRQGVGWRAARQHKTIEAFKKEQQAKNMAAQKAKREAVRKLMAPCPSWHRWEYIEDVDDEFELYWCKMHKESRMIHIGDEPSGTVIEER